jgi:predicted tellurium resistance membrane protein TerC
VLIAAFEIPAADREHLVSSGAFAAFALRVPAILGGVALFESSNLVGYALGALLLLALVGLKLLGASLLQRQLERPRDRAATSSPCS